MVFLLIVSACRWSQCALRAQGGCIHARRTPRYCASALGISSGSSRLWVLVRCRLQPAL